MANIDAGLVRGPQGPVGPQGIKGDPFTYADFTESQITELQRPATEAATRADKATKDAQAAIAEVKATEAKLYPVAENVLKGTAKDTFVHVDDAFAGATLREITVEGACKQDGTPSPDNPVSINVIENPIINVTGRNLLKVPFAFNHPTNPLIISGLTYTRKDDTGSVLIKGKKSGTNTFFNLDFHTDAKALRGKSIFCKLDVDPSIVLLYCGFFLEDGSYSTIINSSSGRSAKVPENATSFRVYLNTITTEDIDVEVHPAIYVIDNEKLYYPYTSQRHEFTLPAEHPYLAKLPDGTADEIVVDREGNVSLIANVIRHPFTKAVSVSDVASQIGADGTKNFIASFAAFNDAKAGNGISCYCNVFKDGGISKNRDTIRIGANDKIVYIYTSNKELLGDMTIAHIDSWMLAHNAIIYCQLEESQTYLLGKITVPTLSDSISNVWTDAEVTPRTGIEYTRDVNIVVANLESAIASITQG